MIGAGVAAERNLDCLEAFLDALGDTDFALAGQQFNGAHLAHVHAHGIGGTAKFGVQVRQCRGRFLDRFLIRCCGRIGEQQ